MLNRITAATQNYTKKEGSSMRNVLFKALAVGLVGLLLLAAGSGNRALADPPLPPIIGQPFPSGGIQFPTPPSILIGITGVLIDKVTDCTTGVDIPPPNLRLELIPRSGAHPPFQVSQLEKLRLYAVDPVSGAVTHGPKEITSFMTMQFNFGPLRLTFIIPLERHICLPPVAPPPPAEPKEPKECKCKSLEIKTGQPRIAKWLNAFEAMGNRAWVQYDIYLPVTYTITCEGQKSKSCKGQIKVEVNSVFNFDFGPQQQPPQKLWDPELKCQGSCSGPRTITRYVRYSFIIEARQNSLLPIATEPPFTAEITFTLTPKDKDCPEAAAEAKAKIRQPGGDNPQPNPDPPPGLPIIIPLPLDPNIKRDPYVAQLETIIPDPGSNGTGAVVWVRVGNNGYLPARAELYVLLVLEDGTVAKGGLELTLPGLVEFSVPVRVSTDGRPFRVPNNSVWPSLQGYFAEIRPYDPDDNPNNNSIEGP